MKTVYLVRHGQTATNAAQVYTGPDEPLSEVGLRQALAYLGQQPEGNILVVTHANFMRTLLFTVLLGDLISPELTVNMRGSTIVSNTGVTVLELNNHRTWKLARWNDTVHLGLEPDLRP